MSSKRTTESSRADEEFRDLLGSTGGRESVDARRVAEIKQAIRPAWEQAVQAAEGAAERQRPASGSLLGGGRSWTRGLLVAATVLGLTSVAWWSLTRWDGSADSTFTVAGARGAFVVDSEPRQLLAPGDSLGVDAVVVTGAEEGGFLSLVAADGRSVRLDAGGRLVLAGEHGLELLEGRVYVDHESSPSERPTRGFGVSTAVGTVTEIGTQFEVELRPGERGQVLHAVVRSGRVLLEDGSRREHVEAGEELVLEDGKLYRRPVDPASERWAWVLASAPPLELADATTHDLLRWLARETGRLLIYESEELEREMASTAIESGRQRVSVTEALAMLPAAGLEVVLQGAELRVRDATE